MTLPLNHAREHFAMCIAQLKEEARARADEPLSVSPYLLRPLRSEERAKHEAAITRAAWKRNGWSK